MHLTKVSSVLILQNLPHNFLPLHRLFLVFLDVEFISVTDSMFQAYKLQKKFSPAKQRGINYSKLLIFSPRTSKETLSL